MNNIRTRVGVFETNSSSTHSLSLSPNMANMVEPPLPENMAVYGVMFVVPGEFGWERETYSAVEDKLSYLFTDAMSSVPYERRDTNTTFDPNTADVQENYPKLGMIVDAVKKYCGVDVVFQFNPKDLYPFGYIDHQSYGECDCVWGDGVDGVIRFVFSRDSYFETDNDNH